MEPLKNEEDITDNRTEKRIKVKQGKEKTIEIVEKLKSLKVNSMLATKGDMIFNHLAFDSIVVGKESLIGPLNYLGNVLKDLFKKMIDVIKDKKKRISVLIIALIWLLLLLLSSLNIDSLFQKVLRFLTFADGGNGDGFLAISGGLIGKSFYVYFLMGLIIPLFKGKRPFSFIKSSLSKIKSVLAFKDRMILSTIFIGIGFALIFYNFIVGNTLMINSILGIAAFMVTLKSISNKHSFLKGFIQSIFMKAKSKVAPSETQINVWMSGLCLGFGLSIPLSFIGLSSAGYLFGMLAIFVAIVLRIFNKKTEQIL